MAESMRSIVVVGASAAGHSAASALRRFGFDGELIIVGEEAHLPYQRPPLSKKYLSGKLDRTRIDVRLDEGLAGAWRLSASVRRLNLTRRVVELDDREELRFDGLVCATGAEPRKLAFAGDLDGVYTLRTIDDCNAIRERIKNGVRNAAIVGAGFIGCEVASTLRECGVDVTLIDVERLPMRRVLNEPLAQLGYAVHGERGVKFELGMGVKGFEGTHSVEGVRLNDGRVVEADLAIVGVGVRPTVEWLAGSGIRLEDGIVCDETCAAVGVDRVVAAGDVARWYNPLFGESMRVEHWDNAIAQGEAAARTLLAGREAAAPFATVPFFWSDQYKDKFQMVGFPRSTDEFRVVEGSLDAPRFVAVFLREGRLVGAFGRNAIARILAYKRLIEIGSGLPDPSRELSEAVS